jgi:hypothetical protein
MTDDTGAVDNDFDDAERSYVERVADATEGIQTEPVAGGLAFDLVTRQPLFVRQQVAGDLEEYYEREGFDLATYKMHPFLPVTPDDAVFECVFISEITAEGLHDWSSAKTYDYPAGRLAAVPIGQAWGDAEIGSL